MTRIAMVGPYPRAGVHAEHAQGGVAAYTKNLVDGMEGRADVLVLAPADAPEAPRTDGDVEVREVDRRGDGVAKALRSLEDVDAVHVQFEQHLYGGPRQNLRLALALRALKRRARVVLTIHQVPDLAEVDRAFLRRNGFPPFPRLARLWMRLQYALLAAACHLIVVHEAHMAERLVRRYHLRRDRIAVVPHGIDAGLLPCSPEEAKRRLGAEGKNVVLYFGYVTGYKGVDLLVEALERVPVVRRRDLKVIIAGKVPERKLENAAFKAEIDALEARIAALGPWVERKGFLEADEIPLHLAAADVVVFPYRNVFGASGPLSIAIGHGRAFLASAAFRGMGVPDESLFPLDAHALATKLMGFFDEPPLRRAIEAEAARLAAERSWPAVARQTLALYGPAKPRVLLMGAYGQDNLGDEALLEVHLQQLRDMDVVVGSTNPHQTSARYHVPSVATYGGLRTIRAFRDSDAVVFGGGSVMKELPKPYLRHRVVASLALLSTLARGTGRAVVFSGVGIEKIESPASRLLARQAERAAHLMHVRDEGSRALLSRLGGGDHVTVVADAAYLLEEDAQAAKRADAVLASADGRPVVVVNPICSHEVRRSYEDVVASFAALVEDVHTYSDAHVLLLPFKTRGEDNDVNVSEAIAARATRPERVSVAPLDLRPTDALAILRRAHFVVAMRHHAVLLSIVADAPVLAVPYAPKTSHLVHEFGLREHALPAEALTPDALREAYWRAYERRFVARAAARDSLETMRARAAENFDRMRSFLLARERA